MSPFITTKHKNEDLARPNMPQETTRALIAMNVFGVVIAVCAAICYLVLLNLLVSRGYTVKGLRERLVTLTENQEKLDRDLAELRSLDVLSRQAVAFGLVKAEQLEYSKPAPAVAQGSNFMLE